jgi:hypothetical protein
VRLAGKRRKSILGLKKKKKKGSDGESYTDYSDSEAGSEIGESGTIQQQQRAT